MKWTVNQDMCHSQHININIQMTTNIEKKMYLQKNSILLLVFFLVYFFH